MAMLPSRVKLRVLARGVDANGEAELRAELWARGLADRVSVTGGWLAPEDLWTEIQSAVAVVLPFVLVPSELPVSVPEVISCGTPAIVTDIDGLPESVGDAGVVVPPANPGQLAGAMLELANHPERVAVLREACLRRRETLPDWDTVADRWAVALSLA
jgi:glycosyltransferase involved in cell wall biosynthesis